MPAQRQFAAELFRAHAGTLSPRDTPASSTTTLTSEFEPLTLRGVPTFDGDLTQTSRGRLLAAAKSLFSRNGYEQTPTAAIAREAGSSESQLIRYFGGKSGVLEAIFNDGWSRVRESLEISLSGSVNGRDALIRVLRLMMDTLTEDEDLAFLFLFESRRIRGNSRDVILSRGFLQFMESVTALILQAQQDGSVRRDISADVIGSALIGCAEGMLRERVLALRRNEADRFDTSAVSATFKAMVDGLAP